MLGPTVDFHLQAGAAQHTTEVVGHPGDELVALHPLAVEQPRDLAVGVTVDIAKRKILQLPLEVADAKAMSQRRVNIENLPCDRQAPDFVLLDRADGAGAFGQLDQRHPDVVHQRYQHFADIVLLALGLPENRPVAVGAQFADRGHTNDAVYQLCYPLPKCFGYLLRRYPLLPHRAVQDTRQQAIRTHL